MNNFYCIDVSLEEITTDNCFALSNRLTDWLTRRDSKFFTLVIKNNLYFKNGSQIECVI